MNDPSEPLPMRMVVEHTYCARLFHFMHVEGLMVANAHVWRGRYDHARTDAPGESAVRREVTTADGEADDGPEHWREARAVDIDAAAVGLSGRLDAVLLNGEGGAIPTERKSGSGPDDEHPAATIAVGAWDADAVHVGLQALALEAMGFTVLRGEIYYASARRRVEVPWDARLREAAVGAIVAAREAAVASERPAPLDDSPKCRGCSLAEVCLPDESRVLREALAIDPADETDDALPKVKRLRVLSRDHETRAVTVSTPGASVRKDGEALVVVPPPTGECPRPKGTRIAMESVEALVVVGNVQVSTQAIVACLERGISVAFHAASGRLWGTVSDGLANNGRLRVAQHEAAGDPARALAIAREMVRGKLKNQRVFLRRHDALGAAAEGELSGALRAVDGAASTAALMGVEGAGSRAYFDAFAGLIEARGGAAFAMNGRNRRPPKDPVNAMLSFGYAILARECAEVLRRVGFDPMRGMMHGLGWGRPALALDLMEEFRVLMVDSTVLRVVAEKRVSAADFHKELAAVTMSASARKAFLTALSQRREEEITHPVFGYRVSYRRAMELQARILAKVLEGEAEKYVALTVR